jgi:hypothetical protein
MPLDRLVAVEFVRRFTTASRPFEGYGEDAQGHRLHLCVKPLLVGRPETGRTLAAEVIGAHIASEIGVPVPETVLVEVDQSFIAATGGELNDVTPGLAFGSVWVDSSFPAAQGASSLAQVVNPEAIAGVAVLDSLLGNTDRHADNVLMAPAPGHRARFRLVFIDNAFSQGIMAVGAGAPALRVPHMPLAAIVTDQQWFNPYLLGVEGLSLSSLAALAAEVCRCGWGLDPDFPDLVVRHIQAGAAQIRPLILSGLTQFPNCR